MVSFPLINLFLLRLLLFDHLQIKDPLLLSYLLSQLALSFGLLFKPLLFDDYLLIHHFLPLDLLLVPQLSLGLLLHENNPVFMILKLLIPLILLILNKLPPPFYFFLFLPSDCLKLNLLHPESLSNLIFHLLPLSFSIHLLLLYLYLGLFLHYFKLLVVFLVLVFQKT